MYANAEVTESKEDIQFTGDQSFVKIDDETANKVYKLSNAYPFTLDGEEKTLNYTESSLNHAVVYYRGYSAPKINYKLGNGYNVETW